MEPFEEFQPEQVPTREPGKRPLWPVGAGVAILLAGALVYFFFLRGEPVEEAPPEPAVSEAPAAPPEEEVERREPIELPALDQSDEVVRGLVAGLSSHPQLARWLVDDDLVRRFTAVVDNAGQGVSPRAHVPFLTPREGFQAVEEEGRYFIDPRGYERYGRLVAVVDSLDADGSVRLYDSLKPLIDQAYRDLGYPEGGFDATLQRAIEEILSAPVIEGRIELIPGVTSYEFADPQLESLSPLQKHLLRMGPENLRRVQAKVREISARLR